MVAYYFSAAGNDANSGTDPAVPKKTIIGGFAAIGDLTGDTCYFANNETFAEAADFSFADCIFDGESWDGSSAVPTYIDVSETASSGNRATINSGDTSANAYSVRVNAVANATIKGFVVTGSFYGLVRKGACSNTILCRVRATANTDAGFGSPDNTDSASAIYACASDGNAHGYSIASSVRDNYFGCTATGNAAGSGWVTADTCILTMTRCTSTTNAVGASLASTGAVTLTDCTFSSNTTHGIDMNATTGTVTASLSGCMVASNTSQGLFIELATKNVTISLSTFSANGGNGVRMTAAGTTTLNRCLVKNNVGSGVVCIDSVLASATAVKIFNTLIVSVAGNAAATGGCVRCMHSTSPLGTGATVTLYNVVTNNRNTSGTIRWSGLWLENSTLAKAIVQSWTSFVHTSTAFSYHIHAQNTVLAQLAGGCNYNLYQLPGSNLNRFREGAVDMDFATWQALVAAPDANSLLAAPGVRAVGTVDTPAYYRPINASSNLISIGGTNLFATVPADYDGRPRPASGAWTAGIYLLANGGGGGTSDVCLFFDD